MKIGKTYYTASRREWREWLETNHDKEPEIWLIYYKKDSGKPRISYDDAVLEALCFGWIDSIIKKIDDEASAQRFSPRKSTSVLSQMNKERIAELVKENLMTDAGLQAVAHVYDPQEKFIIPEDVISALKANPRAWENFQRLPPSYQRIRVAFIKSRKRHGEEAYQKALKNFIKKTAQNKKIGFVKERK